MWKWVFGGIATAIILFAAYVWFFIVPGLLVMM